MRKIKVYIAMSLDGYIATENDEVDWLKGDGSDVENKGTYENFTKDISTVILGHSTYHQITNKLSPNLWPYENMKSYVFTSKNLKNKHNIIFTNEDIKEFSYNIKKESEKDIWICGGANIIKQFHDENEIDEYTICIIPIILGKGIKLFDEGIAKTNLKLKKTTIYNGIVDLVYTKIK